MGAPYKTKLRLRNRRPVRGHETVELLNRIHDMFGFAPEDSTQSALCWNLHGVYCYLRSAGWYLVNYGWCYRPGMPISSSIAESEVNEVVSLRCAKKRSIRCTNKGAHLLIALSALSDSEARRKSIRTPACW